MWSTVHLTRNATCLLSIQIHIPIHFSCVILFWHWYVAILTFDTLPTWKKKHILLVVGPGKECILFWIKKMRSQYFFIFPLSRFVFSLFLYLLPFEATLKKPQSASLFHFPRLTLALWLHCSSLPAPVFLLSSSLLSSLLPSLLSFKSLSSFAIVSISYCVIHLQRCELYGWPFYVIQYTKLTQICA